MGRSPEVVDIGGDVRASDIIGKGRRVFKGRTR